MKIEKQLKGFADFLGVLTFIAVVVTVWKGWEVASSPIILVLPLWGICLFCFVFDCVLNKWLENTTNKWAISASVFTGLIFCAFVFYTCHKGIEDNRMVYFGKGGKYYHLEKDCDKINQEEIILQSRRIDAERDGLEPCVCCDLTNYQDD